MQTETQPTAVHLISERELLRRDVMVVAPFWLVDGDAMELAARLLDRRDLAMAE
jgi:hypothetical protein